MIFPKFIFINDETITRIPINNLIISKMEVGPDRTRPIESVPLYRTKFDISFSHKMVSEFSSWMRNDIRYGQIWFYMNDPMDGIRRRFRLVEYSDLKKSGTLIKSDVTLEAYDA